MPCPAGGICEVSQTSTAQRFAVARSTPFSALGQGINDSVSFRGARVFRIRNQATGPPPTARSATLRDAYSCSTTRPFTRSWASSSSSVAPAAAPASALAVSSSCALRATWVDCAIRAGRGSSTGWAHAPPAARKWNQGVSLPS